MKQRGLRMLNRYHFDLPDDAQVPFIIRVPESIKIIVGGGEGFAWACGGGWVLKLTSIVKWR